MYDLTYLYSQRSITILSLVTALALPGVLRAQMGLGLAPMREELTLAPGATHSGVLTLANTTEEKVRAVAGTLDFYLDSTATPQFGPEYKQEAEFSCRQWLVANPMEVELNGKAQIPVRYTLRVPPSATARSYHCAIGFTTQPTAERAKEAIGMRTAIQIVAAIYVVVGQPALEGKVKDMKLEYVADPKNPLWRAVVTINNAGLMHFRPQGDLDVLDENGVVVETAHFVPLPVLPKRDQNFLFPLKLAAEGKYTLRARVDLGGDEIQEATALVVATKPAP
ncbi:MAG: hypothetical protein ACLQU1_07545 [Bryobacteraceae bacterium]